MQSLAFAFFVNAKFFFLSFSIFYQKQVVLVVLAQKKVIFRAGHLRFCIEKNLFNWKYRKCPALGLYVSVAESKAI